MGPRSFVLCHVMVVEVPVLARTKEIVVLVRKVQVGEMSDLPSNFLSTRSTAPEQPPQVMVMSKS